MDESMPKIVALISGGVDSSTMALLYKKENFDVYPLFVDYNQLSSQREWSACKSVCKFLKLRAPKKISIPLSSKLKNWPCKLTKSQVSFFPFRNAILVIMGALYGRTIGSNTVAIGIMDVGANRFPDCTSEFIVSLSNTLSLSVNSSVKVFSPFLNFSREEILLYGIQSKFPYKITYSCYFGGQKHCGKCLPCLNREQAFEILGAADPTRYKNERE